MLVFLIVRTFTCLVISISFEMHTPEEGREMPLLDYRLRFPGCQSVTFLKEAALVSVCMYASFSCALSTPVASESSP